MKELMQSLQEYDFEISVVKSGYKKIILCLNQPLVYEKTDKCSRNKKEISLLLCDKDNIIIDTVKKAKNSQAIVIRFFDSADCSSNVTIKFGFDISKAFISDLLENTEEEIIVNNNSVSIYVKNFEIVTLLVYKK